MNMQYSSYKTIQYKKVKPLVISVLTFVSVFYLLLAWCGAGSCVPPARVGAVIL